MLAVPRDAMLFSCNDQLFKLVDVFRKSLSMSATIVQQWPVKVASSNLGHGYFATRSTQPSIPPGSVLSSSLCKWVTEVTARCGRGPVHPRQHFPTASMFSENHCRVWNLWNVDKYRLIGDRLKGSGTWQVISEQKQRIFYRYINNVTHS